MKNYNCVVLLGPTAVGKTAIGVQIAFHFNGEIISADSRQTYRGLDIGSGKDIDEYVVDGKKIPYHLIDVADLTEEYNVFNYQKDFYVAFQKILKNHHLPVIVGGTGMYLDAIIRNYALPDVPQNEKLRNELKGKPLDELSAIYMKMRPDLHTKNDLLERERVIRGIEIATYIENQSEKVKAEMENRPEVRPFIIGTTFSREKIRENIYNRLIDRIKNGMVEEVENLHKNGASWERLEKLGLEYKYCALFLQGKIATKEEMTEKLFIAIRQFAKRQETWFRFMEKNGVEIHWLPATPNKTERINAALEMIKESFYDKI